MAETFLSGARFYDSITLSDSKAIIWDTNNILSHNGTQTYLGDATSASTLALNAGNATFEGDIELDENLTFTTNNYVDIANTGTGAMRFKPSGSTLALTLAGANATFEGNIITSGNILLNENRIIARNTSDGSDSGYIAVVGGGAESDGRGAIIRYYGNEHSSEAGRLKLSSGNITGSFIDFRAAGSDVAKITSTGLGIGRSAVAQLTIEGDGSVNSNIFFQQSGSQEHRIYAATNNQYNTIGSSSPKWYWGQHQSNSSPTVKMSLVGDALTAGSFVKSGGTSSQYLMADGSVSTSVSTTDNTKLPLAGGTMTGDLFFNVSNQEIRFTHDSNGFITHNVVGRDIVFKTSQSSSLDKTPLTLHGTGGGSTFGGDVTISKDGYQLRLKRADGADDDWRFYSWASGLNIYSQTASEIFFGRDGQTADVNVWNGDFTVTSGKIHVGSGTPNGFIDVHADNGNWRVNSYGAMYFRNSSNATHESYIHSRSDGSLSIGRVAESDWTGSGAGAYAATTYDHVTFDTSSNATFAGYTSATSSYAQNFYVTSSGTTAVNRIDNDGSNLYITYGGTTTRALEIVNSNGKAIFKGNVDVVEDLKINPDYNNSNEYLFVRKHQSADGGIILQSKTSGGSTQSDWQIVNHATTGDLKFYAYGLADHALTLDREDGSATFANSVNLSGVDVGGVTSPTLYIGQLTNAYQAGMQSNVHLTMKTTNGSGNFYWYRGSTNLMYYSDALYVDKVVDKGSTNYYLDPGSTSTALNIAGHANISNNVVKISTDGTYGGSYGTVAFGGISNGSNRVFGHTGTGDGLFLASATGRGIFFRVNGGSTDNVSFNSDGSATFAGNITVQGATTRLENNVTVGNSSTDYLEVRYNDTANYATRLKFSGVQFGNNGVNKIIAGRTGANGYFDFYVNNTNDGLGGTPDGNLALTIAANKDAAFKGNVDIYTGAGSATLNVGRNSGERLQTYVTDTNITLTATNDADENQEHNFILDRSFGGSGENAFRIRKGGSNQFTIDSGGTARLHTGGLTVDDGLINFARTGTDNLVVIQSGGSTSAASEVGVRLIYSGPGGSTEGSIKMIEQGNNSPNAKFRFSLPKDSGNGVNSTSSDVLDIDQNGDAYFTRDVFTPGLYVNTGNTAVSGTQVAIVSSGGSENLQRWGSATSGQASYRFRIDQNYHFIGNSGSGDMITIESNTGNIDTSGNVNPNNLNASGHVASQGPDGGLILRTWTGGSSYGSFSTANMSGDEYAVLTDGTHTFISGGTGGSVHIRGGNNASNNELEITSNLATFKGNLQVNGNLNIVGNSSVVNVEDLNVEQGEITLNYNASSDTSGSANGAGIRIQDAVNGSTDAVMSWNTTGNQFNFTHGMVIGGTNSSNTVRLTCKDHGVALLQVGDSVDGTQGTGAIEVTQDGDHGGGISYNGDGSPSFASGETADHITFFRNNNGTRTEVFSYPYNTNNVTFNGSIVASGGISGLTLANGGIDGTNYNISGVNQLTIADPGEGIVFGGGSSGNITIAAIDDANDNILAVSGAVQEFRVAGDITATGSTVSATDGNFTSVSATDITASTYHGQSYSVDSTSGTVAIIDTVTLTASDHHAAYEVIAVGNPNAAGSGLYRDYIFGKILVNTGFTNPNVLRFIHFIRESALPRDMYGSGGGNLTMEVVFWDGSSESETFTSNSGTPVIRVKIDGYNSSHVGNSTTVRLKRIM